MVVTSPVSVCFSFPFAVTSAITCGCRMNRSVDDGLVVSSKISRRSNKRMCMIAHECGMIDSGSDGFVVNVISGRRDW